MPPGRREVRVKSAVPHDGTHPEVSRQCSRGGWGRLRIVERPLVVTIDGPAGAGKSATARELARRLGIPYLDTGAMYRAVAVAAVMAGCPVPPGSARGREALAAVAREIRFGPGPDLGDLEVSWGGQDLLPQLRSPEASHLASLVSAVPEVRRELVSRQRELVRAAGGGVVEGRDIGTVVFPDATVKVFLTASAEERANRRWQELARRNVSVTLEDVLAQQRERDRRDASREHSPLRPAPGAIILDTSTLGLEQVVAKLLALVRDRTGLTSPESLDSSGRLPV